MCDGCVTMSIDAYGTADHAEEIHYEMEMEEMRRYEADQRYQQEYEQQRYDEMMRERDEQT